MAATPSDLLVAMTAAAVVATVTVGRAEIATAARGAEGDLRREAVEHYILAWQG